MAFFAEINITPSNSIQLSKIIKFVVTSEIVFLFLKKNGVWLDYLYCGETILEFSSRASIENEEIMTNGILLEESRNLR